MLPARLFNEWKPLVFIVGILFLFELLKMRWRAHKQRHILSWPVSNGQITKVVVHQAKHESILTVSYSYPLPEGPGPAFGEFQREFDSIEEAERWADTLANRAVHVRFNPTNYWNSELVESDLETIVEATATAR
jgi:hypothetical protein